jgi:hypothetical protein
MVVLTKVPFGFYNPSPVFFLSLDVLNSDEQCYKLNSYITLVQLS